MTRALLIGLLLIAATVMVVLAVVPKNGPLPRLGAEDQELQTAATPAAELEEPTGAESAPDGAGPARREAVHQPKADIHEEEMGLDPDRPLRLEEGDEHLDVIVLLADRTPVKQVWFRLSQENPTRDEALLALESEDGRYRLEGLRAGSWFVVPGVPPELFLRADHVHLPHPVPNPGPPVEFVLVPGGGVQGFVIDAQGEPVEAEVSVLGTVGWELAKTGTKEPDGAFAFDLLPPGPVRLRAEGEFGLSAELEVEIPEGRVLTGVTLRYAPGGWILVTVLNAEGGRVSEADVVLLTAEELVGGEGCDDAGQVRFGPLPPGEWSVAAVVSEDAESSLLTARAEVVGSETTEIELRPITEGVTVSGTVTRGGEPWPGETIYFFHEGSPMVEGVSMTDTDDEGHYSVLVPSPGPAQIMIDDMELTPVGCVVIPAGESFLHDIALPAGMITGRVISDAEDRWQVVLEREDGFLDSVFGDSSPGVRTSGAGKFVFEGLRPGRYRLRLVPQLGLYAPSLHGLELGPGEHLKDLELVARTGGELLVKVNSADNTPAGSGSVLVRDMAGIPLLDLPREIEGGFVRLDGLPPGPVRVSATHGDLVAAREAQVELDAPTTASLLLEDGGRLEVQCERGGGPVGASIRLFGPGGDEVTQMLPLTTYRTGYTALISSSKRRFGPLPPGRYEVHATPEGGRTQRRLVTVTAGDEQVTVLRW